jgi:hypothetical protein
VGAFSKKWVPKSYPLIKGLVYYEEILKLL